MNISDIGSSLKLAKFIFSLLTDPEAAIIKVIDDINTTDSEDVSEIKKGLCNKVNCSDMLIEPNENGITLRFIGMKEPVDVFAINIASFIYKLIDKVKPIVSLMVDKEDIERTMNGLTVIHDETKNTTFIEIPHKETILSLEVKSIPEDDTAIIEIPIKSERILEKLREMGE